MMYMHILMHCRGNRKLTTYLNFTVFNIAVSAMQWLTDIARTLIYTVFYTVNEDSAYRDSQSHYFLKY